MKEIDFQILKGIYYYLDRIWEEEQEDYPDYRKIRAYERAIDNRLKKLGADKQFEKDLYATHCVVDTIYKQQNDRLRAMGYIIVNCEKWS